MLTILASDYHPKGLWLDSSQFKVLNYLSRTILRTVNFIKLGAFLGRRFMEYWIKSIFARLRRTVSTKICRSRHETPYGNRIQIIHLVNLSGNLCAINLIAPIFFYNNYSLIAGNKDVTVLNRITHV